MSNETELELQRSVGRMETKLDALIHEVRTSNARHISVGAALSKRIGKLEKWQNRLIAGGTALMAAVGLLFKYFTVHSR
jgi:preprotein translocase subunit SecY